MKSITKTEQKRLLREALKEQERRLTKVALSDSNQKLTERFLALEEVAAAETILLYCSMGAEPDTTVLMERLLTQGKRVVLPRCLPQRQMETRLYTSHIPLIQHPYGMLEPGEAHPLVEPEEIELALVPALAYDICCMRMGRGGGYYDRYLAEFSGITVGWCRDVLLQREIPAESHDRPVDLVLTETRLFRRSEGKARVGGQKDVPC